MNPQFNYKLLLILNQKATLSRRSTPALGFTLTELLVTIVIAALILSSLLWLVVNLLNIDQREYALTETQRDMQRTLDYIVSDMKEAVYIYDGSCDSYPYSIPASSCTTAAAFLASNVRSATSIPVLAFWKTDPVENLATLGTCSAFTTGQTECLGLLKKRHAYSLVVYSQDTEGGEWEGKSRIYRYELKKYASLTSTALTRNKGYVDPAEAGIGVFATWPFSGSTNLQTYCASNCLDGAITVSANGGTPSNTGSRVALTDFVDEVTPSTLSDPTCGSGYQLTPRTAAGVARSRTFYACVKSATTSSANQDIIIYLRGNAAGRAGNIGDTTFTPVLSTQVTMRGVIDKVP